MEIINDQSEDDNDEYSFNFDWLKQFLIEEQYIIEYSLEYGFLRLPPETRKRLNIEVLLVTIGNKIFLNKNFYYFFFLIKDITNNTCFGSGLSRFMLDQFIGYQEILMSSIKQLAEKEAHKGD
jgi:hypothetical protein